MFGRGQAGGWLWESDRSSAVRGTAVTDRRGYNSASHCCTVNKLEQEMMG